MRQRRAWLTTMIAALVTAALTSGVGVPAAWAATAAPAESGDASAAAADPVAAYLDAVYGDLFGRAVDPSGQETWTRLLTTGTPRRAVADAITASDEFRSGLITTAYETYLLREPDAAGLRYWLGQMSAGMTIQLMEAGFLASDEYLAGVSEWPWSTLIARESWLTAVYEEVLGREPTLEDLEFWINALRTDDSAYCYTACTTDRWSYLWTHRPPMMTRPQVALAFLLSTERLSADLDGDYGWLLGRGLDPSGQATWVDQLQRGVRYEQVIGSIIASDEYWALATSA